MMNRRIPPWLDPKIKSHVPILRCLERFGTDVPDFRFNEITLADFAIGSESAVGLSRFVASKDSLAYAKLMKAALDKSLQAKLLVDLGTGSAIPLISAFKNSLSNARGLGIDIDEEALGIARDNIKSVGLQDRIDLRFESFESLLDRMVLDSIQPKIIASNPPYLPCPGTPEGNLIPVHGG